MNLSNIGWTDYTANPIRYWTADGRVVWACEKTSPGCTNCYAETLSNRYSQRRAGDWNAATMKTLTPFLDEKELRQLLTSKAISGKRVFIGDMTDICGEWVRDSLLDEIVVTALHRPDVTLQILTKRAERMAEYWLTLMRLSPRDRALRFQRSMMGNRGLMISKSAEGRTFTSGVELPIKNVHLGFSAENQHYFDLRWPHMAKLAAAGWTTFCSAEPLLGTIDMDGGSMYPTTGALIGWHVEPRHHDYCDGSCAGGQCPVAEQVRNGQLAWVIVGGESGKNRRDCGVEPIVSIAEQCQAAGVPVFVKQDCAFKPGQQGRIPDDIWQLKQFPEGR